MKNDKHIWFKKIPSVDGLLLDPSISMLFADYPRSLIMKAIRLVLDGIRDKLIKEGMLVAADFEMKEISQRIIQKVELISRPNLRHVINATGVVVHTNLGRSILAEAVINRVEAIGGGYSNLEYDLSQGKRGSRYSHVEDLLIDLTSAEAAMVVNNNAAAVLVALDTLAKGKEVIVSRGQLVEIGGSFRIPDVMGKSGAILMEVGTTNKTHLHDYEEAINSKTGILLKVHTSNFQIIGFTHEVALSEMVKLGKAHGIPVMEDLGSGSLVDFSKYGLTKEPTVKDVLKEGADLVTFSGDKLLGGPQAGIILGKKNLVSAIKKNQLCRALRIDKLTLAALEETLRLYRDEKTLMETIPTLKMICQPFELINKKGKRLLEMLEEVITLNFSITILDGFSKVGGGALPSMELPSCLLGLVPGRLSTGFMESWLRAYNPPIITRVEKKTVLLDMRTVQEKEIVILRQAIEELAELM